jgi:hypothetical protein
MFFLSVSIPAVLSNLLFSLYNILSYQMEEKNETTTTALEAVIEQHKVKDNTKGIFLSLFVFTHNK